MLQSCGTSSFLHWVSLNAACSAPGKSPLVNCQLLSKLISLRAWEKTLVAKAKNRNKKVRGSCREGFVLKWVIFFLVIFCLTNLSEFYYFYAIVFNSIVLLVKKVLLLVF